MQIDSTDRAPDEIIALVAQTVLELGRREPLNQGHQSTVLSLLTWNVGNPSQERAERQLEWLAKRPEDILVLTETRGGQGSTLLANRFTAAGYQVTYQAPEGTESGVMIASKVRTTSGAWARPISFLPARAASVRLPQDPPVEVIALYVPSRDASSGKQPASWISRGNALAPSTPGLTMDANWFCLAT
ncbi:MAG: endonuclease/exonuclease/phosphatase family protein [Actinomycetota bacterium]